jgi:hypothetical protein
MFVKYRSAHFKETYFLIKKEFSLNDMVQSRISIKWSTQQTLMATVQTQQIREERW